jgi:hypothetical protein
MKGHIGCVSLQKRVSSRICIFSHSVFSVPRHCHAIISIYSPCAITKWNSVQLDPGENDFLVVCMFVVQIVYKRSRIVIHAFSSMYGQVFEIFASFQRSPRRNHALGLVFPYHEFRNLRIHLIHIHRSILAKCKLIDQTSLLPVL